MNPYIGRRIAYPDYVDTKHIISDECDGLRFLLSIPFGIKSTREKLVVIMKNPSSASAINCDVTVSKVCNVARKYKYAGIIVANLFPIRATNAADVVQFYATETYDAVMAENLKKIVSVCAGRDVVFAWGKDTIGGRRKYPHCYDNAIISVVNAVPDNIYYVDRCLCDCGICGQEGNERNHSVLRYPLHGLRWSNSSVLVRYH